MHVFYAEKKVFVLSLLYFASRPPSSMKKAEKLLIPEAKMKWSFRREKKHFSPVFRREMCYGESLARAVWRKDAV